jgi:hypothetical protein
MLCIVSCLLPQPPECLQLTHLAPRYIPTADMAADILTKVLARVKVETAREQLGLFPISKDLRA